MKYDYTEEKHENLIFQDFVYNENRKTFHEPKWWNNVKKRVIRGAIKKYTMALNSAISNLKNGNIKKFSLKFLSQKNQLDILHFEDKGYPAEIDKIKSHYWYRDSTGKRTKISYTDIPKQKGLEIIYEKKTNRYFLHYQVEANWFPPNDKRHDNQVKYINGGNRVISLDPGVRKFLVGYDPSGYSIFFGDKASQLLIVLLKDVDKNPSAKHASTYYKWKRIKNLVSELQWKVISFLVSNYDIILLPEFRVRKMIKGKRLNRITKRLLSMFSFYQFKTRLEYKCSVYGKRLLIVDESYTSCTCTGCFNISKIGGLETYKCETCGLEVDRDVNGSRNILIKNIHPRSDGF
jgi:hypothetical protein